MIIIRTVAIPAPKPSASRLVIAYLVIRWPLMVGNANLLLEPGPWRTRMQRMRFHSAYPIQMGPKSSSRAFAGQLTRFGSKRRNR